MEHRLLLLCGILVSLSLTAVAAGDVIYEQMPISIGNPHIGSVAVLSSLPVDTENEQTSRAWDDFTLSEEVTINGLSWMGAFNNVFNPNEDFRGEVDFRIEFFPSVGNAPDVSDGAVISTFELDGGTAGRDDGTDVTEAIVPGQTQADGGPIVSYQVDLESFSLQPGSYWLSVQAIQTFPSPFPPQNPTHPDAHLDPPFAWVLSSEGNSRLYSFDEQFGDKVEPGIPVGGFDTAFSLLGETVSSMIDGDFNGDGSLDALDIDLLAAAVRNEGSVATYDVNQDGELTAADHTFWVETLKGTLAGDTNLDFQVAFGDFLDLSRNFNKVGGWAEGNFGVNETIDFGDFLDLSRNFNKVAAASPTAASVPEPGSIVLICLAGPILSQLRRRRKK